MKSQSGHRFLVTGGAGFIGSHLVEFLLRGGHEVVVFDNFTTGKRSNIAAHENLALTCADIRDTSALKTALHGCDGIFHLAAIASVAECNSNWATSHQTNQGGTVSVFEASRESAAIPVVYASSAAVYGNPSALHISERTPACPLSPYGVDKLGSELHAQVGGTLFSISNVGLRFFNVYGPRQDPSSPYSGVISIFIDRARKGLPLAIHGTGNQTRDFVYVADVVAHLMAAMRVAQNSHVTAIYNVCTGLPQTILQLAEKIILLTASSSSIIFSPPRVGDIQTSLGDRGAAEIALVSSRPMTLQDGLSKTINSAAIDERH